MRNTSLLRAISVLLLFVMFHYVAGYRLLYGLNILLVKQNSKETIKSNRSNIEKLTLSLSEFNSLKWTEELKEFNYKNQLFDVVNIEKSGSCYVISVYHDINESSCQNAYHDVENELFHSDQSSKGAKPIEDVLSSLQKDCTPAVEFTFNIYSGDMLSYHAVADRQPTLRLPCHVWHPPC